MFHQFNHLNEIFFGIQVSHALLYHRIEPGDEQILISLAIFNGVVSWRNDTEELLDLFNSILGWISVVEGMS